MDARSELLGWRELFVTTLDRANFLTWPWQPRFHPIQYRIEKGHTGRSSEFVILCRLQLMLSALENSPSRLFTCLLDPGLWTPKAHGPPVTVLSLSPALVEIDLVYFLAYTNRVGRHRIVQEIADCVLGSRISL